MSLDQDARLKILESLVEELIKEEPNSEQVRECMDQVGIPYSENTVECINRVLSALHAKGGASQVESTHEKHR